MKSPRTFSFIFFYSVILSVILLFKDDRTAPMSLTIQEKLFNTPILVMYFLVFFIFIQLIIDLINKYSRSLSLLWKILLLVLFVFIFENRLGMDEGMVASGILAVYLLTDIIYNSEALKK